MGDILRGLDCAWEHGAYHNLHFVDNVMHQVCFYKGAYHNHTFDESFDTIYIYIMM
jgi:hypothetical protein